LSEKFLKSNRGHIMAHTAYSPLKEKASESAEGKRLQRAGQTKQILGKQCEKASAEGK
jgi:hypothetical protein